MIEFFSTIKGLTETFPVIEAKNFTPKWALKAKEEFNLLEDKNNSHIAMCPGIFDSFKTGFIIRSWCDIEIHSNDNLEGFVASQDLEDLLGKPVLQIQSGDGLGKLLPKRPWSNKDILKINTPWHIKSNLKFLMIPLPYSDEFGLESTIGILDPSISSEINIQAYINGRGILRIKAGDPICQLIPLNEKNENIKVRDANKNDLEYIQKRKYINNFGFRLNRNFIKDLYKKFISPKCPFH